MDLCFCNVINAYVGLFTASDKHWTHGRAHAGGMHDSSHVESRYGLMVQDKQWGYIVHHTVLAPLCWRILCRHHPYKDTTHLEAAFDKRTNGLQFRRGP